MLSRAAQRCAPWGTRPVRARALTIGQRLRAVNVVTGRRSRLGAVKAVLETRDDHDTNRGDKFSFLSDNSGSEKYRLVRKLAEVPPVNRHLGIAWIVGLAVGCSWVCPARADVPLVRGGQAQGCIVVASKPNETLGAAIEDLISIIRTMTGAVLPVVPTIDAISAGSSSVVILTGPAGDAELAGIVSQRHEAYRLVTRENRLIVAAANDFAAAHGIYGLLREQLGVRWLMPGDLWTEVPQRTDILIADMDETSSPAFAFRVMSGIADPNWRRRNRLSIPRPQLPYYAHGHNFDRIFTPNRFADPHPEYYAARGGRRTPRLVGGGVAQPCFSNMMVQGIAVAAVRQAFNEKPDQSTFPLCTNDHLEYCECPTCSALDEPRRTSFLANGQCPSYSESYFHFVDIVAREVARSHPDRYVSCYAYWGTVLPPRRVNRLSRNIVVFLTQDTAQHRDSIYRERDQAMLVEWTRLARQVAKYDYYNLGWLTPRYYPHRVAEDIRYSRDHGIVGYYVEAYPYWAYAAPMIYAGAHLLWNPDLDVDALLDDYCRVAFGEAARPMRAFYDALEAGWSRPVAGQWFAGLENMPEEWTGVRFSDSQRAMKQLERAAESARSERVRQRVAYIQERYRYCHRILELRQLAVSARRHPAQTLPELVETVREMERTLAEIHEIQAKVVDPDPLLVSYYHTDQKRVLLKLNYLDRLPQQVLREGAERIALRTGAFGSTALFLEQLGQQEGRDYASLIRRPLHVGNTRRVIGRAGSSPVYIWWSPECLVVEADVKDETHTHDSAFSTMYRSDCFQVGVDPKLKGSQGEVSSHGFQPGVYEFGVGLWPSGPVSWQWAPKSQSPRIDFTALRHGSHTTYHVAIPWKSLGLADVKAGHVLGLSVAVFDRDDLGDAVQVAEWGGGMVADKDASRFQLLVLEADPRL